MCGKEKGGGLGFINPEFGNRSRQVFPFKSAGTTETVPSFHEVSGIIRVDESGLRDVT
jgi:hypothetical protein